MAARFPFVPSYAIFSALVFATATMVTFIAAADEKTPLVKSQDRHPEIAALAAGTGTRSDMVSIIGVDHVREVVITLPDGRYLIQRYYPSGYNVILKPADVKTDAIASSASKNDNS